ncbi:hypothetical protein KY385_00930 [Candidatus Parcubacteria bacterium]|nr:hypothetical protein [Candidatus Parcubacteria bacterium]
MRINTFDDLKTVLPRSIMELPDKDSYSLDRIKNLMNRLGDPQDKIKVIHVAGTSGKTSTSYYIAELLRQNGLKTGLSISPHIDQVNERIQIDLKPLEEALFCKEFSNFLSILNRLSIKLTYFELFTAFAFWYFAKIKVDYAVIETGLGGKLDATNIVAGVNKICVITDIGLDHTDILGSTIQKITMQKAGILQPGNTVFANDQAGKIIDIIKSEAKSKKADLIVNRQIDKNIDLPMLQKRNFTLANKVAEHIFNLENKKPLPTDSLEKTLKLTIPGRIERYKFEDKELILDGAHNTQKMQALIDSLKQELGEEKVCVILAVGKNKKPHLLQMTRLVQKIASRVIITSFDTKQDHHQKSLEPAYIAEYFENSHCIVAPNPEEALKKGLKSVESKVLITGSLYLASKLRKTLKSLGG